MLISILIQGHLGRLEWLITPQIDLTNATTPGLKYYETVYPGRGGFGSHYVMIST